MGPALGVPLLMIAGNEPSQPPLPQVIKSGRQQQGNANGICTTIDTLQSWMLGGVREWTNEYFDGVQDLEGLC